MRALVTGGAGFIGSNLVELLLDEGHEVVVLDNISSGYEENLLDEAEFVRGDVTDADVVCSAMSGCDAVFHLAASVGNTRSIDDPIRDSQVNVIGTLRVLEAARAHGDRPASCFSSSAGIFGELKTLPIREDHPQDPDSPYGASKLAAEKMCLVYNKLYGMSNVCLRYFNVYGVRQRFDAYGNVHPDLRGADAARPGRRHLRRREADPRLRERQPTSPARTTSRGRPRASRASFNLGSGTRITINDLVTHDGDDLGHHPERRPRPAAARRRAGQPRRHRRGRRGLRLPTVRVELEDGLGEYMDWLQERSSDRGALVGRVIATGGRHVKILVLGGERDARASGSDAAVRAP